MNFLILTFALGLDQLLGETKHYHPLVGFGNLAIATEKRVNVSSSSSTSVFAGFLALCLLVSIPVFLVTLLSSVLGFYWFILDILVLYWAIGLKSLIDHTKPIYKALLEQDLNAAKTAVSWIVSRNTDTMTSEKVISATVESTLENGCDSVFAALFWCLIGGAPLVLAYRLVNTLDAMWGYRTERFEYFGKCSAILDDVLNYIPARLTAASYALLGDTATAIHSWKTHAKLLKSPNGGPVMCAGAGSLNVRLGGPTVYHNKSVKKPYFGGQQISTLNDINRSNALVHKTALLWCALILLFELFKISTISAS